MLFSWISSLHPFEEKTDDREGGVVAWGIGGLKEQRKGKLSKLLSTNCGRNKETFFAFIRYSLFLTHL